MTGLIYIGCGLFFIWWVREAVVVWWTEQPDNSGMKVAWEELQKNRGIATLLETRRGGGLQVTQSVPRGTVLATLPENLVITLESKSPLVELLKQDIALGRLSPLQAMLVLVVERLHGTAPLHELRAVMPTLSWADTAGLFSPSASEFALYAAGTTMEGWQAAALEEVDAVATYLWIRAALDIEWTEAQCTAEVRWAYIVLHKHGMFSPGENPIVVTPLFFARPSADQDASVRVVARPDDGVWEVVASRELNAGDEVFVYVGQLSDAWAFCFRG
jgi:hypothetical protein